MSDQHPIPARGETTPTDHICRHELTVSDDGRWASCDVCKADWPMPTDITGSLPVEPAGTPETTPDALLTAVEDNLRWLVNVATEGAHAERDGDNDRAGHYINERVPLHRDRLRAMFAALTSEVSRLTEERDNARRVHLARHARLSEAVGLPVEARFSADATVDAAIAQLAEVSALREAVRQFVPFHGDLLRTVADILEDIHEGERADELRHLAGFVDAAHQAVSVRA